MVMYPNRNSAQGQFLLGSPKNGLKAEASVYEALARAYEHDNNVCCLWSLGIPDSGGREVDFLVVDKERGFAAVEVKSYPIIPTPNGWMVFDPATGERNFNQRIEDPAAQVSASAKCIKNWWKIENGTSAKTPRSLQIIVLAGISEKSLPIDAAEVLGKRREVRQCRVVCADKIAQLPILIREWLDNQNPVAKDALAFWEQRSILINNCGISAEDERQAPSHLYEPHRTPNPPRRHQKTQTADVTEAVKAVGAVAGILVAIPVVAFAYYWVRDRLNL